MAQNEKIRKMEKNLSELVFYSMELAEDEKAVAVTLEDFDGKLAPYATANGLLYFMDAGSQIYRGYRKFGVQ